MFEANNPEEIVLPVFLVARIFGCAPIKSNFDKVYGLIVYSFMFVLSFGAVNIVYSLKYATTISADSESKEIKLTFLLSCFKISIFATIFVICSVKTDRVKTIFKTCHDVDEILKNIKAFKKYDIKSFWYMVIIKICLHAAAVWGRTLAVNHVEGYIQLIVSVPLMLTQHVSLIQYEILSRILTTRLRAVNQCLKKNLFSSPNEIENIALNLTEAHYHIILVTETLNEIYSFQILVYCFNIFLVLNLTAFDLIESVVAAVEGKLVGQLWVESASLFILFIIMLWTLIRNSEMMKEESAEFNDILYHIIKRDTSKTLINNDILVTYVKTKRTIVITAWDLFNVDRDLALAIAGAIASYYVIIKDAVSSD